MRKQSPPTLLRNTAPEGGLARVASALADSYGAFRVVTLGALLLAVMLILAVTAAVGWVLSLQLVDLASKLPDYKGNIQTKLRVFKMPTRGWFAKLSETVEELKKEVGA